MNTPQTPAVTSLVGPDWNRWWCQGLIVLPWVLLALPTVIAMLNSAHTGSDRAIILGLVAAASVWVFFMHTRVSAQRRERTVPMLIHVAGLLALAAALMSRDLVFLLFAITGFFHSYQLNPWPLGVGGIFATSVVLNTMTMSPELTSLDSVGIYAGVILIQTVAIGAGKLMGEKMEQQHEQRRQMVQRLETTLEENAGLHAQLVTQAREAGVLDERQRMAGEIHDTLAQGLTGIITQVQAAQRVWHLPDQAREHVDRALGLARTSLTEARRSVQALRPSQLTDAHLPDALGDLARRWAEDAGTNLQFEVTGQRAPLSPAIEETLFRVAQEALTNVAKHANASRAGLTLSYLHDVVLLDVRDDGHGVARPDNGGFGLHSMRQRVRSVGGSMEVESTPGEGTAINVRVPAIAAVPA